MVLARQDGVGFTGRFTLYSLLFSRPLKLTLLVQTSFG